MRREGLKAYPCRLGGEPVEVTVGKDALAVGGTALAYLDMDEVRVDGWSVRLEMAGGPQVVLDQLGRGLDQFLAELRAARSPVRRAAMLQWTGDRPIDSYQSRTGDEPEVVTLFPDGLTIEAPVGPPAMVPLGLVTGVRRDGYKITLALRGMPPVTVGRLGPRTDEFLADLERARADLARRTAEAYGSFDPRLAGLPAPDGWALTRAQAGPFWAALRAAVAGQERGAEVGVLERLAGDRLRIGVKVLAGTGVLPFALAPVGERVAVEGSDADARATYVFHTGPGEAGVDRLNVVLLLISFRREAVYLPDDQLGRWATAARVLEVVRWARESLAGRVIHDGQWEAGVRAALTGGSGR